jgi:hypothetical protein
MTGQLPSPSPQAPPESRGSAGLGGDYVPRRGRSYFRRPSALLRKLSVVAPLAAAYASFQAVLSSLPPSLSYENIHYLLAVISGFATAALVYCGILFARKTSDYAAAGPPSPSSSPQLRKNSGAPGIDVPAIAGMCYRALLDTVVSFDDPELGRLTGWPHFFHEASAGYRPTAYGTAYGLKMALALGNADGRLDRAALAETLWKLRRSDGGWASRTQGTVGRPEVTAVVLGALAAAGCDEARLAKAGDVFELMIAPEADSTAMTSTYILSSVIRELVRIRPHSPRLAQLRAILVNGTVQDPHHDGLLCWPARLGTSSSQVPSVAHSAMAVVALARVRQVAGDDNQSRLALEQAVHWLTLNGSLANQSEQIRRFVTVDHYEPLMVNLFTAAWTARALMAVQADDLSGTESLLNDAIKTITRSQDKGVWRWPDGSNPVWMTYQGISTLQAFALSHWTASWQ